MCYTIFQSNDIYMINWIIEILGGFTEERYREKLKELAMEKNACLAAKTSLDIFKKKAKALNEKNKKLSALNKELEAEITILRGRLDPKESLV